MISKECYKLNFNRTKDDPKRERLEMKQISSKEYTVKALSWQHDPK